MIQAFAHWLKGTDVSWVVSQGWPWLWPLCEILHFIGMALLVGIVGILDLRMLGVAKGIEPGPFERLVPWAIGGFVLNAITGFLFFAGEPFQYIDNNIFWIKLVFIALAGLNALAFYVLGIGRRVNVLRAGESAPLAAKFIAAISLVLWVGVIYWGRMLPFLGGAF